MRNGATDKDMEDLLRRAIEVKPQRHKLNESKASQDLIKTMSKIGG